MHSRKLRMLLSALVFFMGIVSLFSVDQLDYAAPHYIQHLATMFDSIVTAVLFYCSIGLLLRRKYSWYGGVAILIISAFWETIKSPHLVSIYSVLPVIGLFLLLFTKNAYVTPANKHVLKSTLLYTLLIVTVSTIFAVAIFFVDNIHEHSHFSFVARTSEALQIMYSPTTSLHHLQHISFERIIGHIVLIFVGVSNYLLVAVLLLRPVYDEYVVTPNARKKAELLLNKYSVSSEDYFKLFPYDKSYYFSSSIEGFVAYGVSSGVCVAFADPVCEQKNKSMFIHEFRDWAESKGWICAFLACSEASKSMYETAHFDALKIGENAIIPLNEIGTIIKSDKKLRNILNRFEKTGYTCHFLSEPYSDETIRRLKIISDEWLSDGKSERQFAMGYFDIEYIKRSRIFCLSNDRGEIIAYATMQPNVSTENASYDLLRYNTQVPKNGVDYLLLSLFTALHDEQYSQLDMGLAPFAGLTTPTNAAERTMQLFYEYASKWYSFRGVRQFKNKFHPSWENSYIMYRCHQSRLITVARSINDLLTYK